MKMTLLIGLVAIVALASACSSSRDEPTRSAGGNGSSEQTDGTVPGRAADPSDATRTIVVEASDDLRVDPASIKVQAGEVVTFVVRNVGKTDHEFLFGDKAYQDAHEADVEGAAHTMDTENGVTVAPGESKELTWRFDEAGEVLYACHEPGHYEGGMVGTIEVSG